MQQKIPGPSSDEEQNLSSLSSNQYIPEKTFSRMRGLNFLGHTNLRTLWSWILAALDTASFILSVFLAKFMRFSDISLSFEEVGYVLLPIGVILLVNYIFDLYKLDLKLSGLRIPGKCVVSSFVSLLIITLFIYLFGHDRFVGDYFGRGVLLGAMGCFTLLSIFHHFLLNKIFGKILVARKYLVISSSKEFDHFIKESKQSSENINFDFLSSESFNSLLTKIEETNYMGIILGDNILENDNVLLKDLMKLRFEGMHILNMRDFFERVWLKIPLFSLRDHWFVMENGFVLLHNPIGLKAKRIFDIIVSLILIILTFPIMVLVAILVKVTSKGPAIYSQVRTGEKGRDFTLYKFRSMRVDSETDRPQWAQKNDPRTTIIGKFLRTMRIDELPQLWNVLKGEMSFIGPRPERPEFNTELEKVIPYYSLRHLVRPGITGWAQILYPYGASVEDAMEKLQYDLYYIKNYSLLLDCIVAIKTIRIVLFSRSGR